MKIADFMDLEMLQELQDDFSAATGLAAIAVDAEGNYITKGSNFTDFCMNYTRKSPEGQRRCAKCDNECSGTYFCHAGLIDFSADIVVEGEKVGAMLGGQILSEEPDEEKFRGIARELGINEDAYIEAVNKVPIRSESSIRAAAKLLTDVVNQIVNLEYYKKKVNQNKYEVINEELKVTTKMIDDIQKKTKELQGIASKQNMLALNASIEAARAGKAGAGFAVLAEETGNTAKKSAVIYKEITDAVNNISESMYHLNTLYEENK